MIKQLAIEIEQRALNDGIINKKLSDKGFNVLCATLKRIEKENEQELSFNDLEFLYDYIDISRYS